MIGLATKLALAPALVAAATLVARRWGPAVGGFVSALPVVCGPILLIYDLDHGDAFAGAASRAALLGLLSLTLFALVYAWVAMRAPWPVALAAGWGSYGLATVAMLGLHLATLAAAAVALAGFLGASRALAPLLGSRAPARAPRGDLAMRMAVTAALVLTLTALAGGLGAHAAGLLAPFPIITAVLAAFTQAQSGGAAAGALLAGLVPGLVSFAVFCATVAIAVRPLGAAAAFTLATLLAVAEHSAMAAVRVRGARNVTPASSLP